MEGSDGNSLPFLPSGTRISLAASPEPWERPLKTGGGREAYHFRWLQWYLHSECALTLPHVPWPGQTPLELEHKPGQEGRGGRGPQHAASQSLTEMLLVISQGYIFDLKKRIHVFFTFPSSFLWKETVRKEEPDQKRQVKVAGV